MISCRPQWRPNKIYWESCEVRFADIGTEHGLFALRYLNLGCPVRKELPQLFRDRLRLEHHLGAVRRVTYPV